MWSLLLQLSIYAFPSAALANPPLAYGGVICRLDNDRMRPDRGAVGIRKGNLAGIFQLAKSPVG
jgi:hypothetical protein